MYAIRSYYAIGSAIDPLDLEPERLVLEHRRPAIGEQPLHHPLGAVLILDHGDAVRAGRQDAQRQHPLHGVDDGVITSYSIHYTKLYETTLITALAALALAACSPAPDETATPDSVLVQVVPPGGAELRRVFTGEVVPRHASELGFRVGGKMIERHVDVGDTVHAGQA